MPSLRLPVEIFGETDLDWLRQPGAALPDEVHARFMVAIRATRVTVGRAVIDEALPPPLSMVGYKRPMSRGALLRDGMRSLWSAVRRS